MAYGIAGVDFTLQPTSGRWIEEPPIGITGNGHPIYPQVRSYELFWGLMSISDFDQIRDYYLTTQITGTVVATLPNISSSSYAFKNYSGCALSEPRVGQYFTQHITDVTLVVFNVRV